MSVDPTNPSTRHFAGPRVVDHILACLAQVGVGHLFGVDGANIEDLFDAAHFRDDFTAVLAKHEFSAAAMAVGYSRSRAALGVVAATSGGGCLNLVPGLGEALTSRAPVLALIGQAPLHLDGRGSFQDTSGRNGALNAQQLFATVSVYCERVIEPAEIVAAMQRAMAAAQQGGPAVLLLPKDVQQSPLRVHTSAISASARRPKPRVSDPHPIARALRRTSGPVTVIAGEQVARDDARQELEQLRAILRARVACVPDAKDSAGTPGLGSSSALGVTGVMGHPGTVAAVRDSAVCLLVGTSLPITARAGLDDTLRAVRTLSIGSAAPYVPCTHVYTEDLRVSLRQLAQSLSGRYRPRGLSVPDTELRTELSPPPHQGPGMRYREAMAVLDAGLPDRTDIVVDAGNIGAAAIHYLPVRRDGRFHVALGMGGMGFSFGAAIGMAFATGRRTVVIAGDGAFFMHGLELHTAVEYRLPVTFLLFNNNAHAMCVTREQLFYGDQYSYNRFRPSRLGAGLAAMFPGLPSTDVSDPTLLAGALAHAIAAVGPSVVSVECSADEMPPFAPFLAAVAPKRQQATAPTQEDFRNATASA